MTNEVPVIFKTLMNETYTIYVDLYNDKIDSDVKRKLGDEMGLSFHEIRLVYKGKAIGGDDRVLADYAVKPNTVVHAITRCGGPTDSD